MQVSLAESYVVSSYFILTGQGSHSLHKCISYIIGASLSEPHTSGTALWKCANVHACLRPYTVKFKCAFKYSPKIERPCALPECSDYNHSGDTSSLSPMVPYLLFVTAPTDQPSTANCSLTVQNYTCQVGGCATVQEGVVHKGRS